MSNGAAARFVYTEQQQAALFAQFSKTMELAREGQRNPQMVSRALQSVISDDDIIVQPKVMMTTDGKTFHVVGNFNSAAEAIEAGQYRVKWGAAEKPSDIPLIIQPVDCLVRAIPLGKLTKTEELFNLFPRIVDPMTFLTFGAKVPEEQRCSPVFTVWKDTLGQFWRAVLSVYGDGRCLGANPVSPGAEWDADCRVLVQVARGLPRPCPRVVF